MSESTIEALKHENSRLKTTIFEQNSLLANKDKLIEQLHEELKLAFAKRYGKSCEQYVDKNDPQGDLFNEAELELSHVIDNKQYRRS